MIALGTEFPGDIIDTESESVDKTPQNRAIFHISNIPLFKELV